PKENWLIQGLVDYYFNTNSLRCFEILIGVSDAHEKHLMDKINDSIKSSTTRVAALMLFGRIICKHPPWLHKVATHPILPNLLKVLKSDNEVLVLLTALLNLINLLPVIPALVTPSLNNIFDIFSRLAAWNTIKAANIPETSILHFQVGVYSLFHRLYGMYPCNFLSYLRSHYGNRENLEIFAKIIRPMLDRVRMHPLLVTASKDSELSKNRWQKMEPHAIVMECAKVSLDLIEGISNELVAYQYTLGSDKAAETTSVTLSGACSYVSNEALLFTRKIETSSLWSSFQNDAVEVKDPLSSSYLTSPRASATNFTESQPSSPLRMVSSPSKFAAFTDDLLVKKELPKLGAARALLFLESSTEEKSASAKFFTRSNDSDSDVDKEVYDLVGRRKQGTSILEDSGKDEEANVTICQRSDSVIHDETEGIQTEDYEECGNSSLNQVVELMRKVTRFRYYSHCGQAPEISELKPKLKIHRSQSCPNVAEMLQMTQPIAESSIVDNSMNLVQGQAGDEKIEAEAANEGQEKLDAAASLSRTELMLRALPMMAPTCCFGCQLCLDQGAVVKEMSPAEILDKHVYFGSELHLKQFMAFTSRNPSTSETCIVKSQIVLLYNQLLFERHRRSLHSARNRFLLAKLKKTQVAEEQNTAEKEQLKRKENDLAEIRKKYKYLTREKLMELVEKAENAEALALENRIVKTEIHSLRSENENLKKRLNCSELLNEERLKELQSCQARFHSVTIELEDLKIKLDENTKVHSELERVKTEHLLLGELQQKYRERLSTLTQQSSHKIETSRLRESFKMDLNSMKRMLDQRTQQSEFLKAKLADSESQMSKKELFINDQKNSFHKVKSEYEERVRVLEERNSETLNYVSRLSAYIRLLNSNPEVQKLDVYRQMPNIIEPLQFSQPRLEGSAEVLVASSRRSSGASDILDQDAADNVKKH
uniref:Hamartin n=1 Tax=Strigamia maritima TaxID=126957 RepID=T1IJR6_STRMM